VPKKKSLTWRLFLYQIAKRYYFILSTTDLKASERFMVKSALSFDDFFFKNTILEPKKFVG
jgi:hypothetical protein